MGEGGVSLVVACWWYVVWESHRSLELWDVATRVSSMGLVFAVVLGPGWIKDT